MQEKVRKTKIINNDIQQNFIEAQNKCPLCQTELVIEVEINDADLELTEQAKCPACDLLARVKDHKLH